MRDYLLGEWTAAMWINALAWAAAWLAFLTVVVLALDAVIPE